MTDPDKPAPPAEVYLAFDFDPSGYPIGIAQVFGADEAVRYVRADEGDVVIPAAVAEAFMAHYGGSPAWSPMRPLIDAIRDQQGGAA